MKKIFNYLTETIKKEKNILVFLIIIFIIGMVTGSLLINFISNSDKKILVEQVVNYFQNVRKLNNVVFGLQEFKNILTNNMFELFLIFILGLSLIGIPVVIIIMFIKGFILGTTLSIILYKYKVKGIIGIILYVFPCVVISNIIYIFISFYAVFVSIKFIKSFFKKDNLNFKTFLGKYLLSFIFSLILIIGSSLLDSYFMPLLLKLFTFII